MDAGQDSVTSFLFRAPTHLAQSMPLGERYIRCVGRVKSNESSTVRKQRFPTISWRIQERSSLLGVVAAITAIVLNSLFVFVGILLMLTRARILGSLPENVLAPVAPAAAFSAAFIVAFLFRS